MKFVSAIIAISVLSAAPVSASEPTGAPVDRASVGPEGKMGIQVANYTIDSLQDILPQPKIFRLMLLAKQKALATACDEFTIEEEKYRAAMAVALEDVTKLTAESDANPALRKVLFGYGILLGGELAISAYNPASYCAAGHDLRAELAEDSGKNINVLMN
jgi:hypothetical protein